jgi:hypothetical protein
VACAVTDRNGLALTDDPFESPLPDDLRPIADALRDGRPVADGHLLESVLQRVRAGSRPRRHRWVLTTRIAVALTLAIAGVSAASATHFNIVRGITFLAGSVSKGTSSSPGDSAAIAVYCTSNCSTTTPPTSVKGTTKKKHKKHHKKKHVKAKKITRPPKVISGFTG